MMYINISIRFLCRYVSWCKGIPIGPTVILCSSYIAIAIGYISRHAIHSIHCTGGCTARRASVSRYYI